MSQEGPPVETVVDDPDLETGTPPDPEDVAGAGGPPADPDEPPEDPNWKSLQEKYPGLSDEEIRTRVNASYWEQTKALSAGSKRERELELENARLQGRLEAGPPPDKEPPPPPPEIQKADAHISGLTERDNEVATDQTTLLKALATAKDKVSEVKGKISAAKESDDDAKVERLEIRLEGAQQNVDNTRDKLNATVRERKSIAHNRERAQDERVWLERVFAEGQAREEEDQQELQETLDEIPRIVDGHITKEMDASKVPADPALREDLRDTLRDKITVDLWKAGGKIPFNKLDVPGLVKQYTANYMKAHGLAKRADFGERSKRKAAVAGGQPPPVTTSPQGGKKPTSVVSGAGALSDGMLRGRRALGKAGW